MDLYIDTSKKEIIGLSIQKEGKNVVSLGVEASQAQAEKLLPALDKILDSAGLQKQDLNKIVVSDSGDSFTALRIGIVTANALAFALNIPVENPKGERLRLDKINIVQPKYSSEPKITKSKKKKL
jgi:tRNA A37 threonylcarbamoyladenosine modification protein TsaB